MADGCELVNLKTGDPVDIDSVEHTQEGEARVWGSGIHSRHIQAARKNAIDRAREHFMTLYSCQGGPCDDADAFCVLDVKVKKDRTGSPKSRTIALGPGDALYHATGATSINHRYVTHTIVATVTCKCTKIEKPRRPGRGFRSTLTIWQRVDAESGGAAPEESDPGEDFSG